MFSISEHICQRILLINEPEPELQNYSDILSISKILNQQFQSVFTKKIPQITCNNYPSIGNLSITLKGVQKLLEKMNISDAAGPDLPVIITFSMLNGRLLPLNIVAGKRVPI